MHENVFSKRADRPFVKRIVTIEERAGHPPADPSGAGEAIAAIVVAALDVITIVIIFLPQ
jgi:hypothetical protein